MQENKIVIDTNVLVSAVLFPNSLPAKALDKAMNYWEIVVSKNTLNEFLAVISRNKFDKYFVNRANGRQVFIENFTQSVGYIRLNQPIYAQKMNAVCLSSLLVQIYQVCFYFFGLLL